MGKLITYGLPRWLYEYIPSIYVIAGSLLLAYFPGGIGKPSALLIIWIGVVVFNMRLNHRTPVIEEDD